MSQKIPINMNPIIVLGMHRSGTSAVAGMLSKLGVDMGLDLMIGEADTNPMGYYEDRPIMKLNEDIFALWGGSWDRVPPTNALQLHAVPSGLVERIKGYLDERGQHPGVWGWKDPRTVCTLPIYLPLLENPKIIIVRRDHDAVLDSLDKREKKKTRAECKALIDIYNARLNENTRNLGTHTMEYESLIKYPERYIQWMMHMFGPHQQPTEEQIEAAIDHIKPELNRNG